MVTLMDPSLMIFSNNREKGTQRLIDQSPVGVAVIDFLERNPEGYQGTIKGLLDRLECFRPQGDSWVKSARGLSEAIRRLSPSLRTMGIKIHIDPIRRMHGYHLHISKITKHELDEHDELHIKAKNRFSTEETLMDPIR